MTTIRDYYKKDDKSALCTPMFDENRFVRECGFAEKKLIIDIEDKFKAMQEFGFIPATEEARDFLIEYPVFILEAGTVLCHCTHIHTILQIQNRNILFDRNSVWWNTHLVGHSKYNGGWFTYETSYGGPEFGLNLYYTTRKDIPLLFVPNQQKLPYKKYTTYDNKYTGSHIVTGLSVSEEKGYEPIVPKYFADEFTSRLVKLGFSGYISCDECEIFLTHDSMRKGQMGRPFKLEVENDENLHKVLHSIPKILCEDSDECPLYITEGTREYKAGNLVFSVINPEELGLTEDDIIEKPSLFPKKQLNNESEIKEEVNEEVDQENNIILSIKNDEKSFLKAKNKSDPKYPKDYIALIFSPFSKTFISHICKGQDNTQDIINLLFETYDIHSEIKILLSINILLDYIKHEMKKNSEIKNAFNKSYKMFKNKLKDKIDNLQSYNLKIYNYFSENNEHLLEIMTRISPAVNIDKYTKNTKNLPVLQLFFNTLLSHSRESFPADYSFLFDDSPDEIKVYAIYFYLYFCYYPFAKKDPECEGYNILNKYIIKEMKNIIETIENEEYQEVLRTYLFAENVEVEDRDVRDLERDLPDIYEIIYN
jgi:hypothetical protein